MLVKVRGEQIVLERVKHVSKPQIVKIIQSNYTWDGKL